MSELTEPESTRTRFFATTIEINCHFTRDKVLEGLLQLHYLPTSSQLADILTKVLPGPHFAPFQA